MFTGHFAAALASKRVAPSVSLGTLFLSAQWLDLLWPFLLITGIEKVELGSGKPGDLPLNFTDYPISHSLLAVSGWGLLFGVIYYLISKRLKASVVVGLLVISHWVLDYIVHIPDLPLSPFSDEKVGLGLWSQPYLALFAELLFFGLGIYLYLKCTRPLNRTGSWAFWSLITFLLIIQLMNILGPPPAEVKPVAYVGLAQWLLVAWGYWIDRNRAISGA